MPERTPRFPGPVRMLHGAVAVVGLPRQERQRPPVPLGPANGERPTPAKGRPFDQGGLLPGVTWAPVVLHLSPGLGSVAGKLGS